MAVFSAPGGWRVELVDLELTRPRKSRTDPVGDGAQFVVRRYGRLVAYVRTVEELGEYLDVTTLQREAPR